MKKILFFLIVCNFNVDIIKAQTNIYHQFPDSNAIWNIYYSSGCTIGTDIENYSITTSGDTLINAITYHKLMTPFIQYFLAGTCGITHVAGYKGAIRQDILNKKVFYIPPAETTEQLLYDFNMQVGDTVKGFLETFSYHDDTIISIDSVKVDSTYRKRWNINTCYNIYFIEGIGSTYGLIEQSPGCITDQADYTITCFQQNGQTLYPDTTTNCQVITAVNSLDKISNQVKIFPNPSVNSITVQVDKIRLIQIIDLCGKTVKRFINKCNEYEIDINDIPSGIYLIKIDTDNGIFTKKIIKNNIWQ